MRRFLSISTLVLAAIAADATVSLRYVAAVTPGAPRGEAVNLAQAAAVAGVSNEARASVQIVEDLFRNESLLVGRVLLGSCTDAWLDEGQGLAGARVYLEDGRVDFNGGSGGLVWSAPDGLGFDPWGPLFDDLALWSESSEEHRIGGQAGNDLEGTFFTPNANPFVLSGQGSQFQTKAQFLTRRLELSGQAEVVMSPNPDRVTLIPIREIRLIR